MARILVVDDSEMIRVFFTTLLGEQGHEVETAGDGVEALEKYRARAADLVFMDIFMPRQEGLATITELLKIRPGLPIVAMSAGSSFTDLETLSWAKDFGARKIIAKPLDVDEVLGLVRELLGAGR
ncbi:MAG: response regulator [Acidobacteriota bacterium]